MSRSRRAHRLLGLVLTLPMFGWALTGLVFFVKPGYDAAYGGLRVRALPLDAAVVPSVRPEWLEIRLLRTVLGDHLLVRTTAGAEHLDPATGAARPLPDEPAIRRLIEDAIASDRQRYGEIASVARHEDSSSATVATTTGAAVELDWARLSLQQSGRDTRRIDALYRVHYLQWTGVRAVDRVLGVAGLGALVALAALGVRLAFRGAAAAA